ncbi:MAG: hypothetical protein ACK4ND_05940 [Cytophagaceae bacterium]
MRGKGVIITGGLLTSTAYASMAQTADTGVISLSPQFFFAIIAGVLLALAFQLILTALSAATGISLLGNVREKYDNRNTNTENKNKDKNKEEDKDDTPTGVKITSAAGGWTVISMSLSLFFASWLAVRFSLVADLAIGLTLGLVVWATFILIMSYIEYKAARSFFGAMWNMVSEGFKASVNAGKSLLSTSDDAKIAKVADKTVHTIGQELTHAFDNSKLVKNFDDYIQKLQPKDLDYEGIKQDFVNMLKEIEFKQKTELTDEGIIKKTFIDVAESTPKFSKENVGKLKNVFNEAKNIAGSEGGKADKLMKTADKILPGNEEDHNEIKEKITAYLKSTGKEELKPEKLSKDLEQMMRDPVSSKDIIKKKVRAIDKEAIVSAISDRTDMDENEVKQIVGQVENVFSKITEKVKDLTGMAEESGEKAEEMGGEASKKAQKYKLDFEEKLRTYFNSLEREELNYERLKLDVRHMLHDPGASFSILKDRFSKFDRHTYAALISGSTNLSRGEAELIFDKIEETKSDVLNTVKEMEDLAKSKAEEAKVFAVQQVENTRKTAASAAWWLVATFVVSGIASALGGLVAF